MSIRYSQGDAIQPLGRGPKVICHICNDAGGWGAGFVLAISRRWPEPERQYRAWHADREHNDFALGAVQFAPVEPDLWVANMVAQHGLGRSQAVPPICYEAVAECLKKVAARAGELVASVHMPRIGCGLAGGEWSQIAPLIEEHLCRPGIAVTVYDFEPARRPDRFPQCRRWLFRDSPVTRRGGIRDGLQAPSNARPRFQTPSTCGANREQIGGCRANPRPK
jgi:O-acetyl-ADP-ribose deacetylase (regulator of RNase III)